MKKKLMVAVLTAMFFCGFSQNGNGFKVVPFDEKAAHGGPFLTQRNGKLGLTDLDGKDIIPCVYEAWAILSSERFGSLIVPWADIISPAEKDTVLIHNLSGLTGHSWVKKNGKWGVIDGRGNSIIPFEYDFIGSNDGRISQIIRKGNRFGLADLAGGFIAPCEYDSITSFYPNYSNSPIFVYQLWKTGKVYLLFHDDSADDELQLDSSTKELPQGLELICTSSDRYLFKSRKNGKWGIVSKPDPFDLSSEGTQKDKQIIPYKYDEITAITGGNVYDGENLSCVFVKLNGKWGVVNSEGKQILPCEYDEIKPVEYNEYSYGPFANCFKVKLNGKWGVFVKQEQTDKNGESKETWKQILPCKYDTNEIVYENGYFMHKLNGKWGVVNSEGKQILPCKYDTNEIVYGNGYIMHKLNGKWGVFDSYDGEQILPCKYDDIRACPCDFDYCTAPEFMVKENNKWGVVNSEGKQILPCKYDEIKPVEYNNKYGYGIFANCFKVKQNGKWGVVAKQTLYDENTHESKETWKQILPCEYDTNEIVYEHGYFLHKLNGKWGVFDSEGKQILPCEYDEIKPVEYNEYGYGTFANSFKVKQNGKWGVFVKQEQTYENGESKETWKQILPCNYDEMTAITEIDYDYGEKLSCVFVKLNGKWGVVNSEGKQILPCKYDEIVLHEEIWWDRYIIPFISFRDFTCEVRQGNSWGLLSSDGKEILPCKYQTIELAYGYGTIYGGMHGDPEGSCNTLVICKAKMYGKWGVFEKQLEHDENEPEHDENSKIKGTWKQILPCNYDEITAITGGDVYDGEKLSCVFVKLNGKWGVVNSEGKQILPCKYDEIKPVEYNEYGYGTFANCFKVKQNGKWGVLVKQEQTDKNGESKETWKQILPCKYDTNEIIYEHGYFLHKLNGKWGVVNSEGKQILPCKYNEIKPVEYNEYSYGPFANCFKVKLNGKWGVFVKQEQTDKNGESKETWKQILPCKYDTNEIVYDGYFYFMHKLNGKWGVVNPEGKQILPCNYDSNEIVYEHVYFLHKLNGKWGVVNSEGKQILPCEYDTNEIVYEHGYYMHKLNGKWGVVNSEGKQILPCKYDEITAITEIYDYYGEKLSCVFVKLNGKWGVINSDGKQILPCKYDTSEIVYKNGNFLHRLNGKWGIINSEGELLLPCEYDSISNFSNKYLLIKKSANYGLLTSEFKTYLPCEYQQITALDKGYLMLVKNGKYGIMTDNGKTVLKCEFDSISTTNDNILMKQNGKWGTINTKGAIPCKYTEIVPVRNFYAVKDGKKWGIVGAAGNTILAPTYKLDKVEAFGNFFKVSYKKHFGLLDGTGKLVLPIAYEEITKRDGSSFFVKQKGKWGVADSKGKITVPCSHESTAGISR